MELLEAIKHAIGGNAILFLGAGFSCDGKNADGESMPSASELAKRMCKEMGAALVEWEKERTVVEDMKLMPNLICGGTAVGGIYNSTYDTI